MEQAFTTLVGRLVAERPERVGLEQVEYLDEATGLLCRIVPDEEGRYYGYVAVSRGHPFYALPLDGCPVECREAGSGPCEHSPVRRLTLVGELLQAAPEGLLWWLAFTLPADSMAAAAEVTAVAQQLARIGGLLVSRLRLPDDPEGQQHPAFALLRSFQELFVAHTALLTGLMSSADDVAPGMIEAAAERLAQRLGVYWEALEPFLPVHEG